MQEFEPECGEQLCRLFDLFEKGSDSHEEFASGAGYERSSADEVHSNLSRIIEKSKNRHVELLTEKHRREARRQRREATRSSSKSPRSARRSRSRSKSDDEKSSSPSSDVDKKGKKSPQTLPKVSLDDLAKTSDDSRPTKAIVITRDDDEDDRRRNGSSSYNHHYHSSSTNNRYTYTNNGGRTNNYDRFEIFSPNRQSFRQH